MPTKLSGGSVNPPPTADRIPIEVHPEVVARLRSLLFEPELRGVGYSEFISRACEMAETEIAQERRYVAAELNFAQKVRDEPNKPSA
jgi:hypothetical protein